MVTRSGALLERSQPDYAFDFCGGHVAVDFANTGPRGADAVDHVATFADLVAWADARRVVSHADAAAMTRAAAHDLDAAKRALKRAIDLREAVDAVFRGIAQNRRVDVKALARLNVFVADTFARARLAIEGGTLTLQASPVDPLDAVSTAVVRAAVDLLTSDAAKRIGRCADDTCAWLFLDTTRSGTRRWCDMKQCGNRNKVRRFRAT